MHAAQGRDPYAGDPSRARATGPGGSRFACGIRATHAPHRTFLSLRPLRPTPTRRSNAEPLVSALRDSPRHPTSHFPSGSVAAHRSRCLTRPPIHGLLAGHSKQTPPGHPRCSNRPGEAAAVAARHDEKGRSLSAFSPPRANHGSLHLSITLLGGSTSGEWARKTSSLTRSSLCSLFSPGHTDAASRRAEENEQRLNPRRPCDCETSMDRSRPSPVCGRLG